MKTISLCPTCYREVEAVISIRDDGAMWMTKTCPEHGEFTAMCERSGLFWNMTKQRVTEDYSHRIYNDLGLIEITDRCNVNCTHCYHQPDNQSKDRSASWIVSKALSMPTPTVCLMGAEPTTRDDLPTIIRAIRGGKKEVTFYTNGVRLAKPDYFARIAESGVKIISFSMHNAEYHNQQVYERTLAAMAMTAKAGIQFGQVSFTVQNLASDLHQAIDNVMSLYMHGAVPTNYCVRTPAQIGKPFVGEELFISDMVLATMKYCDANGIACHVIDNYGNNPYHVGVSIGGAQVQFIHWPTAENIDMRHMDMGPWASFIDGTIGSFALQVILRDGMKKGWWQGKKISD